MIVYEDSIRYVSDNCRSGSCSDVRKVFKRKGGNFREILYPCAGYRWCYICDFYLSCYVTGIAEFSFDDILKEVCMVFFFTSVGFQANLKVLKSGGRALIVFLGLVITLILCQNFLAIGLAKLLHISPLVGLCTGSIPMIGGHGTAGAFGPVLEDFGVKGASTLCTAAATFGLIAGSVMGGPVGSVLLKRKSFRYRCCGR